MGELKGQDFIVDPSIFVDILANLSAFLQSIPLLGNLFKGKTQHIPFDTCVAKSNEFGAEFMKIYDNFTASQRHELYVNCKSFYESQVLNRFRDWWNAAIPTDFRTWQSKGWLSSEREATYHYVVQPVFYFMFYEDATRVQETFTERFTTPFNTKVLVPAGVHMKDSSDGSVPQLEIDDPQGSGGLAGLFPVEGWIKWALIIAIVWIAWKVFIRGGLKL